MENNSTLFKISFSISDYPEPGDNELLKGFARVNTDDYDSALKHFEKASSYDNEYGLILAGAFKYYGFGNGRKVQDAWNYFKRAADEYENKIAQFFIGMHLRGDGPIEQDMPESKRMLTIAANKGWDDAKIFMGVMYQTGDEGYETDLAKAKFWYDKVTTYNTYGNTSLSLFGNEAFQINFNEKSDRYKTFRKMRAKDTDLPIFKAFNPSKVPSDIRKAFFWCMMAGQGFALHLMYLGIYCCTCSDSDEDRDKKLRYWNLKSAMYGYELSMDNVARAHFSAEKFDLSLKWSKEAADLGNVDSMYRLGLHYYEGLGVKKDIAKTVTLMKSVLEKDPNHRDALSMIGKVYSHGEGGLKQDCKKALDYLQKAFENGQSCSAAQVGLLYKDGGAGIKQDYKKAAEWYRKSIKPRQGYKGCAGSFCSDGLIYLSIMCLEGTIGNKDLSLAAEYCMRAVKSGNKAAPLFMQHLHDITGKKVKCRIRGDGVVVKYWME